MTVEEIKSMYSMRDILNQRNIRINRAGFCSCPFHSGDNTPSMKVYKDSYNCFGCGANGDIFTFVQRYDGLNFKEAYVLLGGTYRDKNGEISFSMRRKIEAEKRKRELARIEAEKKNRAIQHENMLLAAYRCLVENSEPLSDVWCYAYNKLQYMLYRMTIEEGGELPNGGWQI